MEAAQEKPIFREVRFETATSVRRNTCGSEEPPWVIYGTDMSYKRSDRRVGRERRNGRESNHRRVQPARTQPLRIQTAARRVNGP